VALTHLVGSSVLTRLGRAAIREAIEPMVERRELARAGISDLEVGYSARSARRSGYLKYTAKKSRSSGVR
jgi:hypothetical protein